MMAADEEEVGLMVVIMVSVIVGEEVDTVGEGVAGLDLAAMGLSQSSKRATAVK